MAIKMVREPSETPNINNIDDIVPMRYAYGGQNGFVIGKGTEISNTVSGLNFTVNSGRLVLQGVECDIDAIGVTITIDNIATKRYYTVYLEVNLGLNTATIKDEYDTATYPTIDDGDDLTENTTGIARLPLYQFTATSGIISEVNKVVESVKYTKDVKVNNSSKVNDLEIKQDENGILKIGDIIIPQKQLLWTGQTTSTLNLSQYGLNVGDIIEIEYCLYNSTTQEAVDQSNSFLKIRIKGDSYDGGIGPSIQSGYFNWSLLSGTTTAKFVLYRFSPSLNSSDPTLSISLNPSTFNVLYNMTFTNGQLTSIEPSSTDYDWQLLNVWKVIE